MPPQPSLAGDATFFANGVDVHVTLDGAAFMRAPDSGPRRGGDVGGGGARSGPPRGGATTDESVNMGPGVGGGGDSGMGSRGGGGMGRGGGGGFDGPRGGPPPDSEGDGPRGGPGGGGQPGFAPVRQIIRVVFTNHGHSTAELTVVEVKSILGDFAPRPERLALAAGQSAPLNEMRSSVAENVEELDVTITLRRGAERETKVVRLIGVSPTPPSPRPPQ